MTPNPRPVKMWDMNKHMKHLITAVASITIGLAIVATSPASARFAPPESAVEIIPTIPTTLPVVSTPAPGTSNIGVISTPTYPDVPPQVVVQVPGSSFIYVIGTPTYPVIPNVPTTPAPGTSNISVVPLTYPLVPTVTTTPIPGTSNVSLIPPTPGPTPTTTPSGPQSEVQRVPDVR